MANLFAFGFEGGVVPDGVTLTTGAMRPTVGRRTSDSVWKWGLVASSVSQVQAEVSLALGSALSKVGGSFYFRADNISYTTPLVLVSFGTVTISLTTATNLRVFDGTSSTDYTVTAVTNGWNLLQYNIDLAATTDAISTNFNLGGISSITLGGAVGTTDANIVLRANKGFNSTLEDIRIETAVANSAVPTSIECRKSSIQSAFKSQWTVNGTPTSSSSGINIKGVCYCHSTNLFYAINDVGAIYKMDPITLNATLVITVNSNYGHCAMVYHQALNRIYFVGNGNVAYLDPVGETVTEDAQTVYYGQGTHASGAYYEPTTGNAYVVTLKNTTSTDSVNVHKINVSGTYSSCTNTGTYTPLAPVTRHFNVVYDTTADEILFPMFSSKVIGRVTQALVLGVSNTDGATKVTDINDAGGYWGAAGVFMVASDDAQSRVRAYSTGSISRYQVSTVTNTGVTDKGLIYHPYLGVLFYQIAGVAGGLYQCLKGNANVVKSANAALPSNASVYLLGVNPITGGLLYVYNNSLSECHLLTDSNVSSLQIKDDNYIQSAANNDEMNLLPSAVINNTKPMIKMNACLKSAFGQGSISLAGTSKTVSGTVADFCSSADAMPTPEIMYDFREATSTTLAGWANQGSGSGTIPTTTAIIVLNSAYDDGRPIVTGGNTSFNVSNPNPNVGTGDFTISAMLRTTLSGVRSTATEFNFSSSHIKFHREAGNLNLAIGGVYITETIVLSSGTNSIKIGRESGTLRVFINGLQVYTQAYTDSISFAPEIVIGAGSAMMPYAFAYWATTYITDPNPIAGINRREIVVNKTA